MSETAWALFWMILAIIYVVVFGFLAYVDECNRRANRKDNSHD